MKITKVVDLSVPLGNSTQVYPGDPEPRLTQHSTIARDGFNLLSVSIGSQTGTHVDAPNHFDANTADDRRDTARTISSGRGVVVDATAAGERGRIGWEVFAPIVDALTPGCIVLIHTGWSRHYGTQRYFANPFLDADGVPRTARPRHPHLRNRRDQPRRDARRRSPG